MEKVLVLAGSTSMPGAAELVSRAALRSGAGLVYRATFKNSVPETNTPEAINLILSNACSGCFEPYHFLDLIESGYLSALLLLVLVWT